MANPPFVQTFVPTHPQYKQTNVLKQTCKPHQDGITFWQASLHNNHRGRHDLERNPIDSSLRRCAARPQGRARGVWSVSELIENVLCLATGGSKLGMGVICVAHYRGNGGIACTETTSRAVPQQGGTVQDSSIPR